MAIAKNPSRLLTSKILGSVDLIPQEFLASIGIIKTDQEQPVDVDVDPLLALLIESQVIQTRTNERKKTNTYLADDPMPLASETFNERTGQTDTKTRSLVPVGTDLTTNNRTVSGDQHNLGDGWMDQVIVEMPDLFHQYSFGRERGDVTPEDFKAQQQEQTYAHTEDGAAADPGALPTGTLAITDEDVDIWHHRLNQRTIDILSLPIHNINSKTNQFKQVVTVDRKLELDTATPATPTSTKDVTFTKLGDGRALEIAEFTEEDFFPSTVVTQEIPDALPDLFKVLFPLITNEATTAGMVDSDPLPAGIIERTQQQVDDFNVRNRYKGRDSISFPQDRVALRQFGGIPFGGEITKVAADLDDSEQTVETGVEVVDSKVLNLGNGQFFLQTEKLDTALEWPDLHGQEYDESLDVIIPYVEKTIEQNTELGTAKTDIKPNDKFHARKRTIDATAAAEVLDAYVMTYPSTIGVSFPDKLVSLTSHFTSQTGSGSDSEDGDFTLTGTGGHSVSLDLRADATASATIIPDVIPEIKQFYAPNIPCTHVIFFLPNPVSSSDVLTKLASIVGALDSWPVFSPQTVTILTIGVNSALKVNAVSKGSYSEDAGAATTSSTTGGGTGYSRAQGVTLRRMQISPTIHGELSITGDTTDTVDLEAACDAEATGLGPAESIDQTDTITASITPTTIPATDGATDWPTGTFLYRSDARPYKYGYVMFHAIVVTLS